MYALIALDEDDVEAQVLAISESVHRLQDRAADSAGVGSDDLAWEKLAAGELEVEGPRGMIRYIIQPVAAI